MARQTENHQTKQPRTTSSSTAVERVSSSSKEGRFYAALTDVFVGATVEGQSGYINLMKIKSTYYQEGVFPALQKDIEQALKPFPDFREELFDKLYAFFHRYFSESGSIYFRYTPLHQRVYEKVYTDDRDVMLFYKTHMLYYVKTDRLFQSMEVELDGFRFFFDVSTLQGKKANEKREIVYTFKHKRQDGALVFEVAYSERGRKTKSDDVLRDAKKTGAQVGEETLQGAFRVFERQSEVDYFINKDAKAFLEEQFNLWLYQYVFSGEGNWTEERVKQLQLLKDIAFKTIAFISQFEDELVKIWNKPKFVLRSNYVVTLDRIAERDIGFVKRLLEHENVSSQIAEWRQLGIVEEDFNQLAVIQKDITGEHLRDEYRHLPIDTKYFKALELQLLGLFENLDAALDGWLIKSDNYQALNAILRKFEGRVQAVYIDPPFNTGDDFLYSDRFQDSTWLTIMQNRLDLAKSMLDRTGTIFVHLDWNANYLGRCLLDEAFGKDNILNEIVWRIGWVSGYKTQVEGFVRNHDTLLSYAAADTRASYFDKGSAKIPYKSFQEATIGTEINAILQKWGIPARDVRHKKIVFKDYTGKVYKTGLEGKEGAYPLEDTWNCNDYEELHSNKIKRNAKEYTPNGSAITQKPEQLLLRIIALTTRKTDIVLDYFLGSATSAAVAHKLGRRWIGVEMAGYFDTDALYRMKHVLMGRSRREPCGISNQVDWQGGGFFKYYELEQYEDVLRRAKYEEADLFDNPYQDPCSQYVFLRDLKMLDALEVHAERQVVKVDLSKLYDDIDVPETLSNLKGKWIKRITPDSVEFEDGEKVDIRNLDWKLVKPLIWW